MSVKLYARDLVERLETINRIVACINNLSQKEKNILNTLYVKNAYKEGIAVLDKEYGMPERTVCRIRKTAINNIIKMYYSTATNLELYKETENKNKKYR